MTMRRMLMCALLSCTMTAAAAQIAPGLIALNGVEPGLWQVREAGEPVRDLCLADPALLVQVRHGGAACTRLVIADARGAATVHYSCPGLGWGRTTLRIASPTVVRVDTQGIADNAPFAFVAEARRTGACAAATQAASVR